MLLAFFKFQQLLTRTLYTLVSALVPDEVVKKWSDLPRNSPEGVGYALLLPVVQESINGKAFFVAADKLVEFEQKIDELQPLWMGEKVSADVNEGQRRLGVPK